MLPVSHNAHETRAVLLVRAYEHVEEVRNGPGALLPHHFPVPLARTEGHLCPANVQHDVAVPGPMVPAGPLGVPAHDNKL